MLNGWGAGRACAIARCDRRDDALQDADRAGRAAGHYHVHGDDVCHASTARVVLAKDTARAAAVADRDHPFGFRRRLIGALECDLHVLGNRTGDQQQVRMAGARHEPDPHALDVVVGIVKRVDFQLAAVAGAGVHMADAKRATERLPNRAL